jgi:hypothetical protein
MDRRKPISPANVMALAGRIRSSAVDEYFSCLIGEALCKLRLPWFAFTQIFPFL